MHDPLRDPGPSDHCRPVGGGRRPHIPGLAVSLGAILLVSLIVAAGSEAGVRAAPYSSRELTQGERDCERDRAPAFGLAQRICTFNYYINPAGDGDPERHYVADWIQISAEPLRGRCLASMRGWISVQGGTIVGAAPKMQSASNRARSRLRVRSASGQALGTLTKRCRLLAGTLSAEVKRRPVSDKFKWRWSGRSKHKPVTLAFGVANSLPGSGAEGVLTTFQSRSATTTC
jgi:hypothetical protein